VKTNQKFYICSDGTHTHTKQGELSLLLGTCLYSCFLLAWLLLLKQKRRTKTCKLSRVVTASDKTKIKRICLSLFWFKIGSRGEKREMKQNEFRLLLFLSDDVLHHR